MWAAVLLIWGIIHPDPYAQGWRLVFELAFLGRLVNIADGIAHGFSNLYLFIQSGPQDIILLLTVYPLVVRAYEGSTRKGLLSARSSGYAGRPNAIRALWLLAVPSGLGLSYSSPFGARERSWEASQVISWA